MSDLVDPPRLYTIAWAHGYVFLITQSRLLTHTDVDCLDIDLVENIGLLIQTTESLLIKYDVTILGEEGKTEFILKVHCDCFSKLLYRALCLEISATHNQGCVLIGLLISCYQRLILLFVFGGYTT